MSMEEKDIPQKSSSPRQMNQELLFSIFNKEHRGLVDAKDKELILFLGLSGAGKSTLVNYLKGCEMESVITDAGDEALQLLEGQPIHTAIGQGVESETLSPQLVPYSENVLFADCPGLEENRGKEYRICAQITTELVIDWARSIKSVVVVLDYAEISGRSDSFRRLAKLLTHIFNFQSDEIGVFPASCVFLVNKVPSRIKREQIVKQLNHVKLAEEKKLQHILSTAPNGEMSDNNFKEYQQLLEVIAFINLVLSKEQHILMMDPLDGGQSRTTCLQLIDASPSVPKSLRVEPEKKSPEYCEFRNLIAHFSGDTAQLLIQEKESSKELEQTQKAYEAAQALSVACKEHDFKEADISKIPHYLSEYIKLLSADILVLEENLSDINHLINGLQFEKATLDCEDLEEHQVIRKERIVENSVLAASSGVSSVGAAATAVLGFTALSLAPLAILGAAIAGVAGLGGGIQMYRNMSLHFEYDNEPFEKAVLQPGPEVQTEEEKEEGPEGSRFFSQVKLEKMSVVRGMPEIESEISKVKSDPENGKLSFKLFYPSLILTNSYSFYLRIYLQKKNIPYNKKRLKLIGNELPNRIEDGKKLEVKILARQQEKKEVHGYIAQFEAASKRKKIQIGFVAPEYEALVQKCCALISAGLDKEVDKLNEKIRTHKENLLTVRAGLAKEKDFMFFIYLVGESIGRDIPQVQKFLTLYVPSDLNAVPVSAQEAKEERPAIFDARENVAKLGTPSSVPLVDDGGGNNRKEEMKFSQPASPQPSFAEQQIPQQRRNSLFEEQARMAALANPQVIPPQVDNLPLPQKADEIEDDYVTVISHPAGGQ